MSTSLNTGGSNDPKVYKDTTLTNVAVSASSSACELTGWNFINTNSSDVYVNFCDVSSGTTVVGTSAVVKKLLIPAQSTVVLEHNRMNPQYYFQNSLTLYAVTGVADTNTTAPTTGIYCEIYFKTS